MRATHVIENLTLPVDIRGKKFELTLTSPAEVNIRYEWQPADGVFPPQILVFDVYATDVMMFDADGVTWCYAAGEDITAALTKTDIERIEEALQETRQLEAA